MRYFKGIILIGSAFLMMSSMACKAKTCDAANNIYDSDQRSKRKVKQIGLFTKKEMRRRRWH